MADLAARALALGSDELLAVLENRRWTAARDREPESAHVVAVAKAGSEYVLALVEVRFRAGTHDTYAVALGFDEDGTPREALEEPACAAWLAGIAGVRLEGRDAAPLGVEQSNSSVVIDGEHVLKLYRRLEAGPNPEREVLQRLAASGFAHAPELEGVVEQHAEPIETTLAVVTGFVPSLGGGWELALDSLRGDSEWLPARARLLGQVTAGLHTALVGDADDPVFAPIEASAESLGLLAASIDEEIADLAVDIPDNESLAPLAGRVEDLRDRAQDLSYAGRQGLLLRTHGDYHLGQVLWSDDRGWTVIDFEGEPARSLPERRQHQSPLRDVAGMLRSFAYAADASRVLNGVPAPESWVGRCRDAFLDGYHEDVDSRLLPASEAGTARLIELFELQKLLYELRYELANRPEWVEVPVAGLLELLERP